MCVCGFLKLIVSHRQDNVVIIASDVCRYLHDSSVRGPASALSDCRFFSNFRHLSWAYFLCNWAKTWTWTWSHPPPEVQQPSPLKLRPRSILHVEGFIQYFKYYICIFILNDIPHNFRVLSLQIQCTMYKNVRSPIGMFFMTTVATH